MENLLRKLMETQTICRKNENADEIVFKIRECIIEKDDGKSTKVFKLHMEDDTEEEVIFTSTPLFSRFANCYQLGDDLKNIDETLDTVIAIDDELFVYIAVEGYERLVFKSLGNLEFKFENMTAIFDALALYDEPSLVGDELGSFIDFNLDESEHILKAGVGTPYYTCPEAYEVINYSVRGMFYLETYKTKTEFQLFMPNYADDVDNILDNGVKASYAEKRTGCPNGLVKVELPTFHKLHKIFSFVEKSYNRALALSEI